MIQGHSWLSKAQRRTLSAGQVYGDRTKEEGLGISRQWRNSTSSHLQSLEKGMAGKGTVFCEPQRAWCVQSMVPGEEYGSQKAESRLGDCSAISLIEGQGWHSQLFICKSLPRKGAVDWWGELWDGAREWVKLPGNLNYNFHFWILIVKVVFH